MKEVILSLFSGIIGIVLTIGYQHFFSPPQSFTFIYNGEEMVVTESTYTEIIEENDSLNNEIIKLQQQLEEQQKEISQQNLTDEINNTIQTATDYWNNNDYIQCLTLLKNSKSISTDIESLYIQYSEEYTLNLLYQADELISERNYDDAVKILKEGNNLVSNNKMLNEKIDSISNRPSALLSNLTPVSGEIINVWNAGERDNYGNTYTSGIRLQQIYTSPAHVVYSLDGKYTFLSGKFVLDESHKNTKGNYTLYAYSLIDGNMLPIYSSPILSTATRPINVEIDVTDVMDLVLEVYDPNMHSGNAYVGFVNAKLE